ncbi:TPA: hypothetical protein ACMFTV_004440 [Pseudomonas aeruginosa]
MSELNKESVEQAGGDERAAFEQWLEQHMSHHFSPELDLAKYEDSGEYRYNPAADYWKAWQARAALAQPSPKCVKCGGTGEADSGGVHPWGEPVLIPCDCETEQEEAERPEVVASVVHSNPVVLGQCGPLNANDELMTVAQHAASVARWAEMFNRVEQQRDAAMARVAELEAHCVRLGQGGAERYWENRWRDADARLQELEKQEPVATVAKVPGEDWNSLDFHRDLQDMQPGTKLYTAPVAQAQHSVPIAPELKRALGLVVAALEADGDRPTSKYALSELKKVLAAAPGKEGV